MRTRNSFLSGLTVLLFITASVSVGSANTLYVSPETGADNYTTSAIPVLTENTCH